LELRTPTDPVVDLADSLRTFAQTVSERSSSDLTVLVEGEQRSVRGVDRELLRIGQEAITNAICHAHASTIIVTLTYSDSDVVLRVKDDGDGFDRRMASLRSNHWGVKIMQERAAQAGANLVIDSSPDQGTMVQVTVSSHELVRGMR
jgi:signal transduction histidine kinase